MINYVCFQVDLIQFIGAIDLLEKKVGKTLFISHYGGGKGTKEFQDALKNSFIEQYLLEEMGFPPILCHGDCRG